MADDDDGYPLFIKIVNTPRYLLYMGLIMLTVATVSFKVIEGVAWLNSFYWAVITSVGVGYGDITPHHWAGKILAAFLAMTTMLFFIPMIVASITSRMVVDRNAFTNNEQEELKHDVRKIIRKLRIDIDEAEEKEAGA